MITPDGKIITTGTKTKCDACSKEYTYFVWALGSPKRYCGQCLKKYIWKHGSISPDDVCPIEQGEVEKDIEYDLQKAKDKLLGYD